MKNKNLEHVTEAILFSMIWSFIIAYFLSVYFYSPQPTWGAFPIPENVIEYLSIVFGGLLGIATTELIFNRDLYDDKEIVLALIILGLLTPFTIGLGAVFKLSVPLAISLTVAFEMMIFNLFALAFERATEFI